MKSDIIDTPIGLVTLVFSEAITRLAFGELTGFDRARHDAAREQLAEYFDGQRTSFDLNLDTTRPTEFTQRVTDELLMIGYGQTVSYGELARACHTRAIRAIGTACGTNPLPILVPCHRVVRTDGSLGGYLGGLEAKRFLLDLESGPRS